MPTTFTSLISKKEEVQNFFPISYANKVSALPKFENATEQYLIPVLGDALYATVLTAYNSGDPAQLPDLILKCQAVIVPFGYLNNLPFLQTVITDNGAVATETENSRKAYRWEYEKLQAALSTMGYDAQEQLIRFLKINWGTYPLWAQSPVNSAENFSIIRSGDDLARCFSIYQPQRSRMVLEGVFNTVADMYLIPAIGKEYYDAFNERIRNNTLSAKERQLWGLLQKCSARLAIYLATSELSVRFSDMGFTVLPGRITEANAEANAEYKMLEKLGAEMKERGLDFFNRSINYLNANASATEMIEYFNSGYYSNSNNPDPLDNNNLTGFFAFN